jgi:hypothetical protein
MCLDGALARPCTISAVTGPAPTFCGRASRQHGSGQGHRWEKDNLLHFSGEAKDWPSFKEGMKALRAALKEGDQRLSALKAKFDNFSHKPKDGGNKRRWRRKNATTAKGLASGFNWHNECECLHKQKNEAEAKFQAIKERCEGNVNQE